MNEGQPGSVVQPGSSGAEQSWKFQAGQPEQQLPPPQPDPKPVANNDQPRLVNWSASEFIAHDKTAGWYGLLMVGGVIFAGLVYLLTKDVISTSVVGVVIVVFGIFAARKPRELSYSVDNQGVHIGEKFYPYSGFRSFSIVQEEAIESIWFSPLKRFTPMLAIYFAPDDGPKIVDVLSDNLPLENRELDVVDRLMHRLRF